jgi:hypothetical protein
MTRQEILEMANQARPDLMDKIARVVAVLSEKDPETAREVISDLNYVADHTAEKAKTAGIRPFAAAVGGSIAAGLAHAVAGDLYDAARRGLTKTRNYSAMVGFHKELKGDSNTSHNFATLHRFAPELTSDASLAGSLVGRMNRLPGDEMTVIRDAITARASLAKAKADLFRPAGHGFSFHDEAAETENLRHQNALKLETHKNNIKHVSDKDIKLYERGLEEKDRTDRMLDEANAIHGLASKRTPFVGPLSPDRYRRRFQSEAEIASRELGKK